MVGGVVAPGRRPSRPCAGQLEQVWRSEQILTTNLVAGETWTFLRRKYSHRTAVGFLDRIDSLVSPARLVIHRVTDEQEAAAWEWLRKRHEREYSYIDATSFRVMRDRRLSEALAFDRDFAAAGFAEVRRGR